MRYLIAVLIIGLLLVACAPQEVSDVEVSSEEAEIVPEAEEPVQEQVEEKMPETDSVKEMKAEMSDETKELLGLAEKKVKNYEYEYQGPETGQFVYNFWIKGDKIKIELHKSQKYQTAEDDFSVVYMDKAEKTAMGVCEVKSLCKKNTDTIDIYYEDWNIKTPLDYLAEITSYEIVSTEKIDNREAYRGESNIGMVWIDTYTGVPVQVEKDGKRIMRIEQFKFNQVDDSEVEYQGTRMN